MCEQYILQPTESSLGTWKFKAPEAKNDNMEWVTLEILAVCVSSM